MVIMIWHGHCCYKLLLHLLWITPVHAKWTSNMVLHLSTSKRICCNVRNASLWQKIKSKLVCSLNPNYKNSNFNTLTSLAVNKQSSSSTDYISNQEVVLMRTSCCKLNCFNSATWHTKATFTSIRFMQ